MTIFDSVILGIVEGLTEFLPISSTGHLILAEALFGIEKTEFLKSFNIAIQLGAILAVVTLYARRFLELEILKRVAVAFIPTGLIGFAAYPFVKEYLLGNELIVVWALALGGLALIAFELLHTERDDASNTIEDISYRQALAVGVFQSIAMIPGVSRSGATILGGLIAGLKRTTIVEFSFLLAVPTMAAATGYDLLKSADSFVAGDIPLLAVGFITSFAVALLAIKFLLSFVRTHTFIPFGIYRIVIALLFFLVIL